MLSAVSSFISHGGVFAKNSKLVISDRLEKIDFYGRKKVSEGLRLKDDDSAREQQTFRL